MKLFGNSLNKVFGLLWILAACDSKEPAPRSLEDGKSTVVYDLPGDTQASVAGAVNGKEQRPFYTFLYQLENQRQIWIRTAADSARWLKTGEWDLAFTGTYNSEVFLNIGNLPDNPGYEGPVPGTAVVLLDQSYESVDTAPSDAVFGSSSIRSIGWASEGSTHGWFQYNTNNHIMKSLPNRTYALRLPNGNYAKLQMISAYKGNPPAVTDMHWPAPYLTFRYFVQKDGSRNLKTN